MKKIIATLLASTLMLTLSTSALNDDYDIEAMNFRNAPINREIFQNNNNMEGKNNNIDTSNNYYNDPYYSYQWAIEATEAEQAWESVTENDSVIVAVVDTGVDYTHDDLENRVLNDLGYDFVNNDNDAMDDNGHGTHVSGIIAAEADNGIGITGIAGDLDVSILPIKVLDADGTGQSETIAKGILYAVDMNVDIINLSLGANIISEDIREAVKTALDTGIFVVVAAGNDSTTCSQSSLASLEGVFTVAAITEDDTLADFSNYGDCIDAYAPGEEILSTYLNNQYAYQDGTSMAAPIVSGVAAVLLSQDNTLTIDELTELLSQITYTEVSSTAQSTSYKQVVYTVRVNGRLVNMVQNIPVTTPTQTTSYVYDYSSISLYEAMSSLYNG